MNRRRPYHHRRPCSEKHALTPGTPFRQPLLMCGLLCYLGAAAALFCSLLAPALVLGAGGAACVIRHHSVHADRRGGAQDMASC
jgi:hypothetical protein